MTLPATGNWITEVPSNLSHSIILQFYRSMTSLWPSGAGNTCGVKSLWTWWPHMKAPLSFETSWAWRCRKDMDKARRRKHLGQRVTPDAHGVVLLAGLGQKAELTCGVHPGQENVVHGRLWSLNHRVTELLRLEKTIKSKVIKSNHPNLHSA